MFQKCKSYVDLEGLNMAPIALHKIQHINISYM